MDAIIGRYRISTETSQLILKHGTGMSFALTPNEAIALADFINIYRQALKTLQDELEQQENAYPPLITLNNDEKNNLRHLDSHHPPQGGSIRKP